MSGARKSQCQAPSPGTPRPLVPAALALGTVSDPPQRTADQASPSSLPLRARPRTGPKPKPRHAPLLALLPQPLPRPPLRVPRRPLPPVLPPLLAPCCITHPRTLPDPTPLAGWQRLSGAPPGPRIGGRPREGVSHTEEAPVRGLQWRSGVNGGMMGV